MAINKYLSIIILNISGLNSPIQIHRITEWIRKHAPYTYSLYKRHTSQQKILTGWKEGMEEDNSHKKKRKKKYGGDIPDKIDFKTKAIKKRIKRDIT